MFEAMNCLDLVFLLSSLTVASLHLSAVFVPTEELSPPAGGANRNNPSMRLSFVSGDQQEIKSVLMSSSSSCTRCDGSAIHREGKKTNRCHEEHAEYICSRPDMKERLVSFVERKHLMFPFCGTSFLFK